MENTILQPPRPPERIVSQTKIPRVKQLLHKLGLVTTDPLQGLQGFHPPAQHHFQAPKNLIQPPKPFSFLVEETQGVDEDSTKLLMIGVASSKKKKKVIKPVDVKEFLTETTYVDTDLGKSEFLQDTNYGFERAASVESFAQDEDTTNINKSIWTEREEGTSVTTSSFAKEAETKKAKKGSLFAQEVE